MEDVARDPTIGPELVAFLSQKVKTTREALNDSLEENRLLREEVRNLKKGDKPPDEFVPKQEILEGQLSAITCRIGQCKSLDEVVALRDQIADLSSRLEATEQALQESATSLVDVEEKYEKASTRLKERRDTIIELQKQLREFKDAERSRTTVPEPAEVREQNDNAHSVFQETILISPDQPHIPRKWIEQPCLAKISSLKALPETVLNLACHGGTLYNPDLCVVNPDEGTAHIYECHARYRTGEEVKSRRWVVRSDVVELTGETREVFYRKDDTVCYAGTFEADTDLHEHKVGDYRKLSLKMRQSLLRSCVLSGEGHSSITGPERDRIATQHWSGIAWIQSLRWRRVGFNVPFYMALLNLPNSTGPGISQSAMKRKSKQQRPGPSKKSKD